jgi:hypothetical protein
MSPSLASYLESVRPKSTPHWNREKPKVNGYYWQSAIGDRKHAVMVLIEQGQILRPGTDDSWSLDTFGASEFFGPLSPPE